MNCWYQFFFFFNLLWNYSFHLLTNIDKQNNKFSYSKWAWWKLVILKMSFVHYSMKPKTNTHIWTKKKENFQVKSYVIIINSSNKSFQIHLILFQSFPIRTPFFVTWAYWDPNCQTITMYWQTLPSKWTVIKIIYVDKTNASDCKYWIFQKLNYHSSFN